MKVYKLAAFCVFIALLCSCHKAEKVLVINEAPVINRVSFAACGDNIIYRGNTKDAESLSEAGGREYNFKPMYDRVKPIIEEADIAFINQETLMCGEGYEISYYPCFNSPQDLGYDLVELGYDVVNIANNHMLDKGSAGLSKTIEFWKNMDCLMIGGYEDEVDFNTPKVIEKNGISIAFLSFTESTNGNRKSKDSKIKIPYLIEEDVTYRIEAAKSEADFVVVSVHWGDEGAFSPNQSQKQMAQLMSDCGADVIIGHHPHVIQPVEWLTGEDGNKTLCVYSLGNFAAEQEYAYNMVGGVVEFDIVRKNEEAPYVENVVFNPTVFHYRPDFYGNRVYLMKDYTPELAQNHGVGKYYGNSISYEKLLGYVRDTIDDEFLDEEIKNQITKSGM